MSWVKLDDQFADHPKLGLMGDLGPLAGWLYVCGLCYAARYLTDGFIPRGQVGKLASFEGIDVNVRSLREALVNVGLWEAADGGYLIHDYLEYNPSREEVTEHREHLSQVRSEAGKRGAESRWADGKNGKPMANGMANAWQTDGPVPVPVPTPDPTEEATALFESAVASSSSTNPCDAREDALPKRRASPRSKPANSSEMRDIFAMPS